MSLLRDGDLDPLDAGVAVIESFVLRQSGEISPAEDVLLSGPEGRCWRDLADDYERWEEWGHESAGIRPVTEAALPC